MTIATFPLTIIADDREKAPYTFAGLGDVHVIRKRLTTGDYSLPFHEDDVAVTRKSLDDLYATLLDSERHARFLRELRCLAEMTALVLVEDDMITAPPPAGRNGGSKLILINRVRGLQADYPAVQWQWWRGRRGAEAGCFAWLLTQRERLGRNELTGE